jgi:hypothetical protein
MKSRKYILLLLLMSVVYISSTCEKMTQDDNFSMNKSSYTGNELRMDGYYYFMTGDNLHYTYFFYRNGIIIHGGGNAPNTSPIEFVENQFISENYLKSLKDHKTAWGIFQITGNKIEFERWYPSSGGLTPAYIRSGEILNDTTFVITKSVRAKTGEEKELNEIYHFKEFSPKPDSTNSFIK